MGILDLFKKEACCLCGGKTGLLDKKCKDGKICRECTGKLSVWFEDYGNAGVAELKSQLAQKQADAAAIGGMHFDRVFGEFGTILLDGENRCFVAFAETNKGLFSNPRKVKSIQDVMDLGPDLIRFDQVKDFEIKITETTREEKKTENGAQVSYDPPHIIYMETFTLRMQIEGHPYIRSVYVQLNDGAVQIKNLGYRRWTDPGRKLAAHLLGLPGLVKENQEAVYDNDSLLASFLRSPYELPDESYGFRVTRENWDDIRRYQYYLAMAREIQQIIVS